MTPSEIRKLTLYQLRLVAGGYKRADQVSRYKRMNDKAKETAKRIQAKHGEF